MHDRGSDYLGAAVGSPWFVTVRDFVTLGSVISAECGSNACSQVIRSFTIRRAFRG